MTGRVLTLATLRVKGASQSQVGTFRSRFGESADVTPALCIAHADAFPWGWWADKLLSPEARATWQAAIAPAHATYQSAVAQWQVAYDAAYRAMMKPAWNKDQAQAWAEQQAAEARAWAVYQAARAKAWAEAYIGDVE